MTPKSGRILAWCTFVLGVLVSVLGNIGHAASDGMKPGEWAGAAFWPTALMLSVEVLTRVRWQKEKRWSVARFAGLIVVSVVSAVLSYLHLRGLLLYWGESPFQATIGPAAVDGMMLLAAAALLSISKERNASTDVESTGTEPLGVPANVEEWSDWWKERVSDPSDPVMRVTNVRETANGIEYDAEKLRPEPEETPDPVPAPEPQKSKLHVVNSVSADATESAAMQAFFESNGEMRPQDLMEKFGMSRSTAYRRRNEWQSQISGQRIGGR